MKQKIDDLAPALTVVVAAIILCGVLLALTTEIVGAAERGSTAADRPDWQEPNTLQNIYENHAAWADYTDAIDSELLEADFDLAIDLAGESFSVTMEFLQVVDEITITGSQCKEALWFASMSMGESAALIYASMYFNWTTSVGEPIDTDPLFEAYEFTQNYTISEIPDKCWNKLDY